MKISLPAVDRVRAGNGVKNGADSGLGVPALERGLALLEHLAQIPGGATLSELTAALAVSPASAHRITNALEELGYLRREEKNKRFFVTRKLLLLGQPQSHSRSLVECSVEAMRKVLAATGETTQLCCLAENQCVIIDQLPSIHPFKYIVDPGSRAPIHCAAPGKAILAFLPPDELEALLGSIKLERFTQHSLTTRKELLAELEEIRASGYAVDRGEHFDGIHCVAAPLLNHHGRAFAAITIAGPKERIPRARFAEFGRIMIEAAKEAAQRFAE